MQGPQRSPPPGPQPVGGAVPRSSSTASGKLGLLSRENQREIAKAGTIGVAGPPREIGEKHMGCGRPLQQAL